MRIYASFFVVLLCFLQPTTSAEKSADYVLPYPQTVTYKVLQGFNGPYGHEGHAAYAYDFQMPLETAVHAARSGKVIHVVQHHRDSTRKPGEENVIVIQHEDGTYARYYHLTRNGSKVAVEDNVKQGHFIGMSGDSGASAGPHLHFDVTEKCFEWGCQTVEIEFQNAKENPLKQGASY